MGKTLVTYFSASGTTKGVAERIAKAVDADLFEIDPVVHYTMQDLDWTNKESRSSKEMNDRTFRPDVARNVDNIDQYDKVVIGFPVWWYTAPTIINTFIEENNLEGKDIYIFVTSGSSDSEGSYKDLTNEYPNLKFVSHKRYKGNEFDDDYIEWLQ